VDAAGAIDLLEGGDDAGAHVETEGGRGSGERRRHPELQLVGGTSGGGRGDRGRRGEEGGDEQHDERPEQT
jgi:hypothetical protein